VAVATELLKKLYLSRVFTIRPARTAKKLLSGLRFFELVPLFATLVTTIIGHVHLA
jgi:hypothetical protein